MARNTISPRAARILFTGIGLLLLVQFWGLAAMEMLTGDAVEYHKGRPPTEADRASNPAGFNALVGTKLALGAVLGGGFLVLAQVIWFVNWIAVRKTPEALGTERVSRKWLLLFAGLCLLLLAVYAFVFWRMNSR